MIKRAHVDLVIVLVAMLLLQVACAGSHAADPAEAPTSTNRWTVDRGPIATSLVLTGEIKAREAVSLSAPNVNIRPLQLKWIAEDGAEVKAGDTVAELDSSQLLSNFDEQVAQRIEAANQLESEMARVAGEIDTAELDLERRRAELDKARLDAEIPERLLAAEEHARRLLALRRAELELAEAEEKLRTARESGQADIEIQRIAFTRAHNAMLKADGHIELMTLRAPRDGIVLLGFSPTDRRSYRPGDSTWPGMPLLRLPDLSTLYVKGQLFDVDDGRVEAGQRVSARLDAFPEIELEGRILAVDEMADQPGWRSLRRVFHVDIEIEGIDPQTMRPGMSVQLRIDDTAHEDILRVPRAALVWHERTAWAVDSSGEWRHVEIGLCDTSYCQVSSGLEAGDRLRAARASQRPPTAPTPATTSEAATPGVAP